MTTNRGEGENVIAWVFGVPLILMVMVLALEKLEARVVAPAERSERIRSLVERAPAEEVERQVAVLVAPVMEGPTRPARAS